VGVGLAETESNVCDDSLARNPGALRRRDAFNEKGLHVDDDVSVVRRTLHRGRITLLVHQAHGTIARRDHRKRTGRGERLDIVDHGGPGRERRAHHAGAARINRDRDDKTAQRLEHRQ